MHTLERHYIVHGLHRNCTYIETISFQFGVWNFWSGYIYPVLHTLITERFARQPNNCFGSDVMTICSNWVHQPLIPPVPCRCNS